MEHDPIAPDTLKPVVAHGDVTEEELENVRVDGPEPPAGDERPVPPDAEA